MTSGPGEQLEQRLRRWTANHDPHFRAAVDLLIAHNSWLRRRRFVEIAVHSDQATGDAWISWQDARQAFDAGAFLPASSTELAVLDLAIALGEDRYLLSRIGDANSRDIGHRGLPGGHRPAIRRRAGKQRDVKPRAGRESPVTIRTTSCVWVECDGEHCDPDKGWPDDGLYHFPTAEAALEFVIGDNAIGWTRLPDGRLLCKACSLEADCDATGHQYSPWRPSYRRGQPDPDIEVRFCLHCGGAFDRLAEMGNPEMSRARTPRPRPPRTGDHQGVESECA